MYKFSGFFNFMLGWFYNFPMMMMDVMYQQRNVNDMFFTVNKIIKHINYNYKEIKLV